MTILTGLPGMASVKSKLLAAAPTPSAVVRDLRHPLLRNGYLLTLSSGLTAVFGFGYWAVSAWKYDAPTVGSSSAAIAMMTMVATIAQFNLSSAVVRFVPAAKRRTKQLVAGVYIVGGCGGLVVAACLMALIRFISPGTNFFAEHLPRMMFVFGTVAYVLFIIQEGVLTALRRTALVPLQNFVFVAAKLGLVVAFAAAMPRYGIFASWALSQGCILLAVGIYVFVWAIPRHRRDAGDATDTLPPVRQVVHFVAFDYVGAIFSVVAVGSMPIVVIALLGAEKNAYFSMAWVIAFALHQINFNMGTSLVVESAEDQSRLAHQARHVMAHTSKLLAIIVVVLLFAAPYVLGLFGSSYREADVTLQLLALSALPHLIVVTAISSARARRRMALVVWIQVVPCVLSLALMWVLLPIMGMAGAGVAWLVTQSAMACALLIRRDLWLTPTALRSGHSPVALWRLSSGGKGPGRQWSELPELRPDPAGCAPPAGTSRARTQISGGA